MDEHENWSVWPSLNALVFPSLSTHPKGLGMCTTWLVPRALVLLSISFCLSFKESVLSYGWSSLVPLSSWSRTAPTVATHPLKEVESWHCLRGLASCPKQNSTPITRTFLWTPNRRTKRQACLGLKDQGRSNLPRSAPAQNLPSWKQTRVWVCASAHEVPSKFRAMAFPLHITLGFRRQPKVTKRSSGMEQFSLLTHSGLTGTEQWTHTLSE